MGNHEEIIYIRLDDGEEEEEKNKIMNRRRREEFKQFDIILAANDENNNNSSISDHHFASSSISDHKTNKYSSQTSKRIMKEWKILEESLPDSIYVRAYEERIDLLRAVIIGAAGTPYHDGLFFFDIQFPSRYPNVAPKVYHHSFGFPLSPLMHKNGTLCLSLLKKNWFGKKNERWNPSESTVLQVLVSIQALVINADPYDIPDDLGYVSTSSAPRRIVSLALNQDVFVSNCMIMLKVLARPPSHFEEFVAQHFRERAETILIASKAYIDGRIEVGGHPKGNICYYAMWTKHFQDSMEIIYSKLLLAFIKNGSSLEEYVGDNMDDHLSKDQAQLPDHPVPCWLALCLIFGPPLVLFLIIVLGIISPY
ncbi:Ubiquitin-conjugating enzyme [Macleaya cordata]|uniref:Ubiquitin-conjugating enzyme n=1 Tax=Macleaya cordata TaxID=56857 RepID=A0A200PS67_MACCD|nr:Ubiquitin-conjugating enzyme [Macleaya cordata]